MSRLISIFTALSLVSCGSAAIDDGESLSLDEDGLQVELILQFLNGPDATREVLWHEVGLTSVQGSNIFMHVNGPDMTLGTADDDLLGDLAELDAIPQIGDASITKIDKYVVAKYGAAPTATAVTVEGVSFTAAEAQAVLDLLNNRWDEVQTIGLSGLAIMYLGNGLPYSSIQQVAATKYVATATLNSLRSWVLAHPVGGADPVTPAGCAGGTFDGVSFTKDEECAAVEFLNNARYSEMYRMPDAQRRLAYCRADGACTFRSTPWSSVQQLADGSGVGKTTISALKTSAAGWKANGLRYDTVATTWASRSALVTKPVYFDKVYVTKQLADWNDGTWTWFCAEIRDAPTAPNYLIACFQGIGADSAPVCSWDSCFKDQAGTWHSMRGTLKYTSQPGTGGYRVNLIHERLADPNPAVK